MNLVDLEKHRKNLLLKKSKGNATEEDLKQLARILDLINRAEPSIVSEINKKIIKRLIDKEFIFSQPRYFQYN